MVLFLLFWWVISNDFSGCAHAVPKSRAKVVEEYVISAKLDENQNFPQLQQRSQLRDIYQKDGTRALLDPKDVSFPSIPPPTPHASPRHPHQLVEDFEDRNILEERDLLVHHHHLPPAPPSPPPPIGLHYGPSFFAIGLITFLLLLNSLQTSLLVLKSRGSLLGSVTGALGRRKRFAGNDDSEYGKRKLNFTPKLR